MHQNSWKPAMIKEEGGQAAPRWTFWSKFFWYPAVTLGILMMLLTLRLNVSHALEKRAWQKASPATEVTVYAAAHASKWDRPLTTLTSDDDDGDDDDNGDDCPTTST
jgi:hypothetical protein